MPEFVSDKDGIGTFRLLETIGILGLEKKARIYQASNSELCGKVQEVIKANLHLFTRVLHMQ